MNDMLIADRDATACKQDIDALALIVANHRSRTSLIRQREDLYRDHLPGRSEKSATAHWHELTAADSLRR